MEHQIKQLKDREVDQKNKASGYETLLRDGIPLNEHFLALKNKFNNEQDSMTKNANMVDEELKKEENSNVQKNRKIENLKREYEELSTEFQLEKETTLRTKKDLETRLYTEIHTRDTLTIERTIQNKKIGDLKSDNQNMGRAITKDRYYNNREDAAKEKKRIIDEINEKINKVSEQCEIEQAKLEEEIERNEDPHLLKRQKETTMQLKQDHNKMKNDITLAENRIKELEQTREIINSAI